MSSDVANVYLGAQANDGSGDPIRNAFNTVNNNLFNIDTRITTGNIAQVYATIGLTGQYLKSNTSTTTQTLTVFDTANIAGNVNIANLQVNNKFSTSTITTLGNVDVGGFLNVSNDAAFAKSVVITGNLTVLGNSVTVNSSDLAIKDSIINLHTDSSLEPLTVDDGKDIGIQFHYFKDSDKHAALVWANDSQALEFYSEGTESAANTFTGTYGHFKVGSLFVGNTGAAITTTGNISADSLSLTGGFEANSMSAATATFANLSVTNKVIGSLYLSGGDTIYVNGSPVATSSSSFSGGTVPNYTYFNSAATVHGALLANSNVASTSTTTGAAVVMGGLGVTGRIYAGSIQDTPIGSITPNSGSFTTLSVASSFAANNVTFIGGNITNVSGQADNWSITTLVAANAQVTSGNVTGLTNLATSNFTSSNAQITSGTVTGLSSFSSTNVSITSGSLSGVSGAFTSLASSNGITITGNAARITGDFTTNTISNRVIFQTSVSNGATTLTAMPRGAISSGLLTSALRLEDSGSVVGNGSYGSLELFQNTELRLESSARGISTYLPVTMYTGGTQATKLATNHDFTIYKDDGTTPSIQLSANTANAFVISANGAVSIPGTITTASTINGAITTAYTANIVTSPAQTSITSVGTLTELTVSGDILPTANASINIGSATSWFNEFYGVSMQAKYADLAELYSADTVYAPGTVLIFGGDKEVTTTNEYANTSVAGVVSTKPAYLMNSDLKDGTPIALRGRVPVNVIGRVSKGDLLITSNTPGFAASAGHNKSMGPSVFAKAIEDKHTDSTGTIEAVIL